MVMAGVTTKYVFDLQPGDVYWCTADCGWITGHTYLTYGPLLNGAQNVIFEGVPTYPDPSRCWQIVEKHKVCLGNIAVAVCNGCTCMHAMLGLHVCAFAVPLHAVLALFSPLGCANQYILTQGAYAFALVFSA